MRKLIWTVLMAVGVSVQASAANSDDYAPEFRAYTSFNFGAASAKSLGLHYGLRMDNDSRANESFFSNRLAVAQVDFSADKGFESARVYGMPLVSQAAWLNAAGETGLGTKILWMSGYVVIGGVIYGIHEWSKGGSTPAPAAPQQQNNCNMAMAVNAC